MIIHQMKPDWQECTGTTDVYFFNLASEIGNKEWSFNFGVQRVDIVEERTSDHIKITTKFVGEVIDGDFLPTVSTWLQDVKTIKDNDIGPSTSIKLVPHETNTIVDRVEVKPEEAMVYGFWIEG